MRTKAQILDDTVKITRGLPQWDSTESIHERLTIEVLIDIRDLLKTFTEQHKDHWELYHPPKGGEVDDKH